MNIINKGFLSGIVAPDSQSLVGIRGSDNNNVYIDSASNIVNFIVDKFGLLRRRHGTIHIKHLGDITDNTSRRLIVDETSGVTFVKVIQTGVDDLTLYDFFNVFVSPNYTVNIAPPNQVIEGGSLFGN